MTLRLYAQTFKAQVCQIYDLVPSENMRSNLSKHAGSERLRIKASRWEEYLHLVPD